MNWKPTAFEGTFQDLVVELERKSTSGRWGWVASYRGCEPFASDVTSDGLDAERAKAEAFGALKAYFANTKESARSEHEEASARLEALLGVSSA